MEQSSFGRSLRMGKSILAIMLGVVLLPALLWWSLAPKKVESAPNPAALAVPPPALTVTKTADTADGTCDADCSLREAIIAANANPGPDVITLPAGTYILTLTDDTNINGHEDYAALGDLDIRDDLTINGAGEATTIIDGNDAHRIFHVLSGTVTINDVTLQNGRSFDQGGAIRNAATLVVNRSTITGNVGSGGGGILNAEFDYSVATSDQPNGPAYNWIDISGTGTSSTDAYRSVDLGFDFVFYGETFNRLWIVRKGYVTFDQYKLESARGETSPIPETDTNASTALAIHAHYHATAGPTYWEVQGSAPNRVAIVQYDRTSDYQILLFEGSNLIKVQYKDAYSQNDRGTVSGSSGVTSIGIVDGEKRQMGTSFAHGQQVITDTFAIAYTPLTTRGNLTLDDVTLTANQVSAKFDGLGLMNGGTATVRNSVISHHLRQSPAPNAGGGVNGSGIANRGQLTVENSRIFENQANPYGNGAGLSNHWGSVTISNSQIYSNSRPDGVDGSGGGLSNQDGTMVIVSSAISRNVILEGDNSSGGGVFNLRGHLIISNTDIISNYVTAGNSGGAVQSIMGIVEIYNSRIEDNEVGPESSGGAIDAIKSRLIIDGSVIADNRNTSTASDDINAMGGAIRVQQGQLDITNSQMMNNTNAGDSGGAIAHISGDRRPIGYTMIDSNFVNGPTYDWVDISSTGTALSLGDDDYYTANLPFSFYFYNVYTDTVYVSSNGFLTFDTAGQNTNNVGCADDETDAPNLLIAGLGAAGDDLDPSLGGEIYVETLGTAPNRRYVVQYDNVKVVDGTTEMEGGVTFQIILYESSIPEENIIRMQYKDLSAVRRIPKTPSFSVKLESGQLGDYDTYQATVYRNCYKERIYEDEVAVEFKPAGRLYAVGNTFTNNSAASYGQGIYTDGAFPLGYAQLLNNIFDAVTDAFSAKGLATKLEVTPTQFTPGQTITYTLAFTNESHVFGMDGLLTDVTASGRLTNISVQGTRSLIPTGAPTYTWQLPLLGPKESGVITITADTVGCADIVSSATITTSPWSWLLPNDREAVTVTLAACASDVTFVKAVVGDNPYHQPSDWTFDVDGGPTGIAHNATETLVTGTYTVTESGPDGYTATGASGACSLTDGVISLTVTESGGETCTITNTRRSITVASVTDAGDVTYSFDACYIANFSTVAEGALSFIPGKPDLDFPFGFFSFTLAGCDVGGTVNITVTLPSNLPTGSQLWKNDYYGWFQHPFGSDDGDNVITFSITDGGAGDTDGTANGVIVDPAGPGTTAAGVILTESFGVTDLDEDGSPVRLACYWVTLASAPSADVTITPSPDAQVMVQPTSLVLNSTNWDALGARTNRICVRPVQDNTIEGTTNAVCASQKVDIYGTGADDFQVCGSHLGAVGHSFSSSDANYNGAGVPVSGNGPDLGNNGAGTIDVLIRDDDTAGLIFNPAALNVLEGGVAEYSVRLRSQPTGNVSVAQASSVTAAGVDATTLTFTPQNWNVAQTLSVTLPDDNDVNGIRTGGISHGVNSGDGHYNGLSGAAVTLPTTITDDDSASAVLSRGSVAVAEGGAGDTYAVRLASQPTADVVVTVAGSDQVTASPGQLTFTPDNWNVEQSVSITAIDDAVDEGDVSSATIGHTASSSDPAYNGAAIATVLAEVTDNDTAALAVGATAAASIAEGASTSYGVALATQPTGPVQVFVVTDGKTSANPAVLTFDASNWNVAQTVTLTGADDDVDNAANVRTSLVTHAAVSGDGAYNGVVDEELTVDIVDNDVVAIRFSEANVRVAKDGQASYSVTLATRPLAPVVVELAPSDGVTVDAGCVAASEGVSQCLVFTPENWNVAQTLTLTALTDASEHIDHLGSSADAGYNGLNGRLLVNGVDAPENSVFLPLVAR